VHRRRAAIENGISREPYRTDAVRWQSDRGESQCADGCCDSQCHRRCLRRTIVRAALDGGENLLGDAAEELAVALLIRNQDVEQVLDIRICLDAIEEGIKEYYRGD